MLFNIMRAMAMVLIDSTCRTGACLAGFSDAVLLDMTIDGKDTKNPGKLKSGFHEIFTHCT
jgi:hypothetical protein